MAPKLLLQSATLALIAAAAAAASSTNATSTAGKPNVVFIVIDDLGFDGATLLLQVAAIPPCD